MRAFLILYPCAKLGLLVAIQYKGPAIEKLVVALWVPLILFGALYLASFIYTKLRRQ